MILLLFLLVLSLNQKKGNAIVFNTIWLVSLAINSLCYDVIDEPSTESIFYILIFILAFNIGCYIISDNTVGIRFGQAKNAILKYKLNKKLFIIVNLLVTTYFFVKYTIKSIQITAEYGLWQTRVSAYLADEAYFGSTMDLYIAQQLIYGVFYTSMIIGIIEMVKGKQKYGWINIIGVLQMVLYSFTFKGRSAIVSVIFYLVITFFVFFKNRSNNLDKKRKKKIRNKVIPIVIIVLVYVAFLSISRFGGTAQIKKYFVIYFGGAVTYLSKLVDTAPVAYVPGRFSLCGVLDFLKLIINVLFGTSLKLGGNEIGKFIDGATNIGGGLSINAMCSSVFYFYIEFGLLGIISGGFLTGSITSIIQQRYKHYPNERNLVIYILSLYLIFYTYSGWSLKYLYFWLVPVLFAFFYRKEYDNELQCYG